MNYYPFHLGDYAAHTAHLEPMEDLAYRRMLDLYYRTERALSYDWRDIARLIRMRDYGDAIESVLAEFFTLTDEGWVHARCDAEIARMQDKQTKARASAQAMLDKRANAQRTLSERSANAQQSLNERSADGQLPTPTPTPTPTPKNKEERATRLQAVACPPDVAQQVWDDWKQLRKTKRAPVTETVLKAAQSEADKAGLTLEQFLSVWCARGSQGLEASWLKPEECNKVRSSETAYQRSMRERVEEASGGLLAKRQQTFSEVINAPAITLG